MPFASLVSTPISREYFGHGPESAAVFADASATATTTGSNHVEALSSFLDCRPVSHLAPRTSFKEVFIKFMPRDPAPEVTELPCEDDMAICNRECEKLYGEREAEMEEPCKLAVSSHFSSTTCFPGTSLVHERCRGTILVGDIRIGDEIKDACATFSRVVALLHSNTSTTELYLEIRYRCDDGSAGCLTMSPDHLLRVRKGDGAQMTGASFPKGACKASVDSQWDWIAAQDVRSGDEVEDERGHFATVEATHRTCCLGAFAPLTASGQLVVDGVICSCYAPPAHWAISHSTCHAAMLPLRLLDSTKASVEHWTRAKGAKDPFFTVDALWLLPDMQDTSLHPWASGLLRTAILAQTLAQHCKSLFP